MTVTRSIAELTRAIRIGEGDALTWLYRSRIDRLTARARQRTRRDESFCLDIVQETFLRVIRSLPALDDEAALDAWLCRTLDRCAIDALRSEARRRRRERRRSGPTTREAREPFDALWPRLSALPAATLDLLEARFRFNWTLTRIGERFGLTPGAVDGRITRTIERLRKELEHEAD